VAGMTVEEFEKKVQHVLSQYTMTPPRVVAEVKSSASRVFYVFGAASYQGKYSMGLGRVTLLDAIMMSNAGATAEGARATTLRKVLTPFGFHPDADTTRVYVITPSRKRKPQYRIINVADIIKGSMRNNVTIKPNQIIYMPSKITARAKKVLREVLEFAGLISQNDAEITHLYRRMTGKAEAAGVGR